MRYYMNLLVTKWRVRAVHTVQSRDWVDLNYSWCITDHKILRPMRAFNHLIAQVNIQMEEISLIIAVVWIKASKAVLDLKCLIVPTLKSARIISRSKKRLSAVAYHLNQSRNSNDIYINSQELDKLSGNEFFPWFTSSLL